MSDITDALIAINGQINKAETEDIDQHNVFAENLALSAALSLLVACIKEAAYYESLLETQKAKLTELIGARELIKGDTEMVEKIVVSLRGIRSSLSAPLTVHVPEDDLPF